MRSREKIKGTGRGGGGSGHRKECCSEVPIQRMGHRAPVTQTAKLTKDPKTALSVSHLLASASRSHHFWGFCLLLHGQDTENTSCTTLFPLPFSHPSPGKPFLILKKEGTGKVWLVASSGVATRA